MPRFEWKPRHFLSTKCVEIGYISIVEINVVCSIKNVRLYKAIT